MKQTFFKLLVILLVSGFGLSSCSVEYRENRHRRYEERHRHDRDRYHDRDRDYDRDHH